MNKILFKNLKATKKVKWGELLIVILPLFFAISCSNDSQPILIPDDVKDVNSSHFFSDSIYSIMPSLEVDTTLSRFGEKKLTLLENSTNNQSEFPQGYIGYFNNVDAFKEDISQAPGYMLKLKSIDAPNKAVYFEPIKSAQITNLKTLVKVPKNANLTSVCYNSKSQSTISFILGKASVEQEDAYSFIFKEDLYADIRDFELDTAKMNKLWRETSLAERSSLFIVMQAYVVSYITSQYRYKKLNISGSIPTQGGAIKIGNDCYVGGTNKDVVYKAKIVAFPLRNFVTNPNAIK